MRRNRVSIGEFPRYKAPNGPGKAFPFNQIEHPLIGDRVRVWFKGDDAPRPVTVTGVNRPYITKLDFNPSVSAFIASKREDEFDILTRKK